MSVGKPWSESEDKFLINAVKSGNKAREIATYLGRSEKSVQTRCNRLKLEVSSLKQKQSVKSFNNADVRCPFFDMFYRGKSIKCEGIIDGGYIRVGFKNEGEWRKHVEDACNGDYCKCPVYLMLEHKYNMVP